MGAFGYGVLENDSTVDFLISLRVLYEANEDKSLIRRQFEKVDWERLEHSYEHDIDFYTEFWTAILYSQWMYSDGIEAESLNKIEKIVKEKPVFYGWGEPDEPQLRLASIIKFYDELSKPRDITKNKYCKIWFFENSREMTNNFISEKVQWKYETLKRLNYSPEDRVKILLKLFEPLENDYEEAIFWSTIGECELNFEEVQNSTREKLMEISEDKDCLRVFRVAYNEMFEKQMWDSMNLVINRL